MNVQKKPLSFMKTLSKISKNINKRAGNKEIEFYHKNKLNLKIYFSIFRELIYILKNSNVNAKSAQITYTFILAIVPFLSILFTFVHSLHGFENIYTSSIAPIIKSHFGYPMGVQISDYLQSFIKNIEVKELGIISFITFSVTVIFLLISVEDNLNDIMQVQSHMTFFQRFIKCWIIITVSPFLFALTAVKSDPVFHLFHLIKTNAPSFLEGSLINALRFLIGIMFQSIYFIFIYSVLPSKRLNVKSLFVGGILASILLEFIQYVNVYLAKMAVSGDSSKIYGTVPLMAVIFFAWIRLGWLVTLIGAACSLAAQRIFYHNKDEILQDFPAKEMLQCITIYCTISKMYKEIGFPIPFNKITLLTKIPTANVTRWLQFLLKKGVIFSSENKQFTCYSPSYKALQEEDNVEGFLKELLFLNHTNAIKNYNDIEKYFLLCLKGKTT